MLEFLRNLLDLSLEAAPWLVLGLIIGGLIKALVPTHFLNKHLSGNGMASIVKAAIFGAPLPLCSCGVIPAALGLRRAGASKPATISFLVSTPETGVDSVTISYALLGPFMAIVRPIAAIASAIVAGLLVGRSQDNETPVAALAEADGHACCSTEPEPEVSRCCSSATDSSASHVHATKAEPISSCCGTDHDPEPVAMVSCCSSESSDAAQSGDSCCGASEPDSQSQSLWQQAWAGIVYSFNTLFVDVLFWLVMGLVFAALVKTFIPMTFLAEWGSGLPAMLIMLVIGIPMYVCATASTPIAAGLLLAGVSPGTAMVFLMAGPATNISTLGIIGKELGRRPLIAYLTGVGVVTLLTGFIVDYLVAHWSIDIKAQISHSQDMVPAALAWLSLMILVGVVFKLKLEKFFRYERPLHKRNDG